MGSRFKLLPVAKGNNLMLLETILAKEARVRGVLSRKSPRLFQPKA